MRSTRGSRSRCARSASTTGRSTGSSGRRRSPQSARRSSGAHLRVTGLADKRTRWSLGPLGRPLFGSRIMRPGLFGYDVSVLQFLLTRHGMYDGPLDGYLSTATDKALRRYQRQVRLVSDGVVGPKTVAALVLQNRLPVRPQRVSVSTSLSRTYVVKPGDSCPRSRSASTCRCARSRARTA